MDWAETYKKILEVRDGLEKIQEDKLYAFALQDTINNVVDAMAALVMPLPLIYFLTKNSARLKAPTLIF